MSKRDNTCSLMWIFVLIAPFFMMIFSFIFRHWGWGLMDDMTILGSGSNFFERTSNYFKGLLGFGEFKPLFAFHSGVFYTIFESHPKFFYVFKLFEIYLILFIWGFAAYRFTGRRISIILVPAITLSFHYFYDAFFYLSAHEAIGLLFLGLSLHCCLSGVGLNHEKKMINGSVLNKLNWVWVFLGIIFLIFSFGSKETFVSCGMAFGLSFLYLAIRIRKNVMLKKIIIIAILIILASSFYAVFLMNRVKSGYTSGYDIKNFAKVMSNLKIWFKKDFINHLPWLIAVVLILFLESFEYKNKKYIINNSKEWGIVLGLLLYFGFLLILLPWNTVSYYATPLGLFFAFIISILISEKIIKLKFRWQICLISFALLLNMFICNYSLLRESTYQEDTYNLMEWINHNHKIENFENNILCNAMEASDAIPKYVNFKWNLGLASFKWSTNPNEKDNGKQFDYYLYSPRFGGINKNEISGWEINFLTDNWIMYHRI